MTNSYGVIRLYAGNSAIAVRPDEIVGFDISPIDPDYAAEKAPATHVIEVFCRNQMTLRLYVDSWTEAQEGFEALAAATFFGTPRQQKILVASSADKLVRASSD